MELEVVNLDVQFTISTANGVWYAHREKSPYFCIKAVSAKKAFKMAMAALDWYEKNG